MTRALTIRRPDDWHLHLRDGAMLRAVLPASARHFGRAIIMPNLLPPVLNGNDASAPIPSRRMRGVAVKNLPSNSA